MKRIGLRILFILVLAVQHQVLAQLTIPTGEISFEFVSKNVKGTIKGYSSKSTIDFDSPENSSFEGSVAVKTLDTNNGIRNWHLKGKKYFNEDKYPRIYYKSTTVTKQEDAFLVAGELSIKGIARSVAITFIKQGNRLKGTAAIYTSDFGIEIKNKREDNLVNITLLFDTK